MTRIFDDQPATRTKMPLLVSLFGPSGSGKTFSALRLAEGMQSVNGGEIFFIDTEGQRAKAYADEFKFRHIDFKAPFGSLDYLAALQHCVGKGAGVVIVDSMSHEHEGDGGYLATQEAELTRLAGTDQGRREKMKFSAWVKPSTERRKLINGVLQLNASFIFCFRAKDKLKVRPGQQPVQLGYMPISGEEFLFEMTAAALLLPGAYGVPTWAPENQGEKAMVKLPRQFQRGVFPKDAQLDQDAGRRMAQWAAGGTVDQPAPQQAQQQSKPAQVDAALVKAGDGAAAWGSDAFRVWWQNLTKEQRTALGSERKEAWKAEAAQHEPEESDGDNDFPGDRIATTEGASDAA